LTSIGVLLLGGVKEGTGQ